MNTKNTNIKVVQKKHESITLAKVLMYIEESFQYSKKKLHLLPSSLLLKSTTVII